MRLSRILSWGFVTLLSVVCQSSWAGVGRGKVLDVTIRAYDSLLLVKVESHDAQPSCAVWYHTLGKPYDGSATSRALYAMLIVAQAAGTTVRVAGTGACLSGTGAEEIQEANIGPWGN